MRCKNPLAALIRRFGADRRAVSAIEFAMIAPVLMLMLMGTFDVTRAVDVKNKTLLLSRTIADFVAQNPSVTELELQNIVKASKFVMYPYPDASPGLTVKIESVFYNDTDKKYWVDWSYAPDGTPKAKSANVETSDPIPDVTSVRATVTYAHNLKFIGFLATRIGFSKITMTSTTHMSPRSGTRVTANGW
jgi:Flp pilus assembly protein TadG